MSNFVAAKGGKGKDVPKAKDASAGKDKTKDFSTGKDTQKVEFAPKVKKTKEVDPEMTPNELRKSRKAQNAANEAERKRYLEEMDLMLDRPDDVSVNTKKMELDLGAGKGYRDSFGNTASTAG
jgi:hypothetical protein